MQGSTTFEAVDPAGPEARWCLDRYFRELGRRFEAGFDPKQSILVDHAELVPPHGVFLVMRMDGRTAGCGAVKKTAPDVGYIKRMWVDDTLRGRGLGRRLLEALERAALGLGCAIVQLETNQALAEAIRLYRGAGYVEVAPFNDEPYAHHWFEKRLER